MKQTNFPISGEKSAKFLTTWIRDLSKTRFDVSEGIRRRVIFELAFLTVFQLVLVVLYFVPEGSGYQFVQVGSKLIFILKMLKVIVFFI